MSGSDTSTKVTKENFLSFNASVNEGTFLSVVKLADATPIFKNISKNSTGNCRPISILKNVLKVFENA